MRKVLRWLACLYLGYLGLSLVILLPALNFAAPWFMEQHFGRQLSTRLILFDPFRLALEIRHAALQEVDGGDFASLDRAAVNLSLTSIWQPGIVLDELALEGLDLHLRRLASGDLNIADFAATSAEPAPAPAAPSAPPALTINKLLFSAHRIRVSDEQRDQPFSSHWDNLAMQAQRLSTVHEEGRPYRLRLSDELGGVLEWSGEVSLPEAYSTGTLRLTGIALRPLWRFIEPWVQFELVDGRLDIGGNYRVAWGNQLNYGISDGGVTLSNLNVTAADPGEITDTGVSMKALKIGGIELDGGSQRLQIGSVAVDSFALDGWMEGDRVSIADLFAVDAGEQQVDTGTGAPSTSSEPGWQVHVTEVSLNDSALNWRTPFTEPGLLQVAPVNARLTGIQWPATAATALALNLQVNGQAILGIDGSLNLGSGVGELVYDLKGLPLAWFGPNLPSVLRAEIGSGQARADGRIVLDGFAPVRVEQDGAIDDFAVVLHQGESSLTRWQRLAWQKLKVDLEQQQLGIEEVYLNGYAGRVHILQDGTLNFQQAFGSGGDESQAQASGQAPSPPGSAAMSPKQAATTAVEASGEADAKAAPWAFEVPAIFISDSAIDFMDESLPVVFRTVIGDLNGEITGVSSDPGKALHVAIEGSVDGYAPVKLEGSASPLSQPPALDLGLGFDGVDLARLTPYSGTYAGHAIDQGVLNVRVRYSLQDNHLKGDNRVVIDQLKLGRKVDSDKAVDLPLQLAIALLTDSRGIIDLAVPVSGDVNSPSFSLGSVIAGAFINLITKAVTAPFNLLANLIGSEEDLQRVTFAAGSIELDETGQGKLMDLSGALKQRPKLKLAINGRLHPTADPQKLRQQQLRAELLAAGLTDSDIDGRSEAWGKAIAARYAALPQQDDSGELPALPLQARAVQASIAMAPDALRQLAQERAATVKRFLVNQGGMAADRAVIAQTDVDDKANSFSGIEMSLDN